LVPYKSEAQPQPQPQPQQISDPVKVFFLFPNKIGTWRQSIDEYPGIHLQHGEPSLGEIDQRHARVSNRQE
jgi:hypothetical protein